MNDVAPTVTMREHIAASDRHKIFSLLNATGHFLPREMAYGMDLFDEHLIKRDISSYRFIIFENEGSLLAYGCYGALRLTDRRYHLHWLAVDRNWKNQGMGRLLERRISDKVRMLGGTRIYAETSNRDYHKAARTFYESIGYQSAATIPGYYGDQDDMVLYSKDLL